MNDRNKIAIINSVCGYGSTGRICVELAEFLNSKNLDAMVFYGRNKIKSQRINAYYFGNKLGVYFHAFLARLFDSVGLHSKLSTKKLIKKLEEYNPDLIILNNLHGYYLNYKNLLRWIAKRNKKTICVFHDCWNFTGHCAHFDYLKCYKWISGCQNCPGKKEYPSSIVCDKSKRNYLLKKELFTNIQKIRIVVPSNWLKTLAKKSFFNNFKITVINNGVDTKVFLPNRNNNFRKKYQLENKNIILCVANVFNKRKGLFDVINLSKKLDSTEVIVIVGRLNPMIELPNNVIHISHTESANELSEIYSSCDVMFNPTYEDTFSNTNMEALSCGLPVVCYKTGGATEMLDKRFTVEQGDFDSACQLIRRIYRKEVDYNLTDLNFSKDKMHKAYLILINDFLNKQP